MSQYDNETYLKSLATARGSIDRQVNNTLAEVGRQQQTATAQTTKVPAAVDATNTQVRTQANGVADTMSSALSRLGLAGIAGGEVDVARSDVEGRLNTVRGAFGRASGLLAQGFGEQGDQRRGQVGQIGQQLRSDNDLQRVAYIGQRESEDRQAAFAREQAQRQEALARWQMGEQAGLQRESLASQRWMQGEAIGAAAAQAQADRAWQLEQISLNLQHQGLMINPVTGQIEPIPTVPQRSPGATTSKKRYF
jgi:hypothetical protein